jgi:hypothetical protein
MKGLGYAYPDTKEQMMDKEQSVEEMVTAYRKIRDAIRDKEEEFKEELASLKEQLDLVAGGLLDICNTLDVDSLRTNAGTVSRRVNTRYWTSDWDAMYQFIKEHDAPFLLEQRIHNGNLKQFLADNPEVLPVGLQADN